MQRCAGEFNPREGESRRRSGGGGCGLLLLCHDGRDGAGVGGGGTGDGEAGEVVAAAWEVVGPDDLAGGEVETVDFAAGVGEGVGRVDEECDEVGHAGEPGAPEFDAIGFAEGDDAALGGDEDEVERGECGGDWREERVWGGGHGAMEIVRGGQNEGTGT